MMGEWVSYTYSTGRDVGMICYRSPSVLYRTYTVYTEADFINVKGIIFVEYIVQSGLSRTVHILSVQ